MAISSSDVGNTAVGNEVALKIDAFPYQRHGLIKGRLRRYTEDSISGGATVSGSGPSSGGPGLYHRSRVELTQTTLRAMPQGARLIPGMSLTADIKAGRRRAIAYFLYPILGASTRACGNRDAAAIGWNVTHSPLLTSEEKANHEPQNRSPRRRRPPRKWSYLPAAYASPEWREVRLDIDPNTEPDIIGSITDMKAITNSCVDAVFSSHNIEHVYAHEVQAVLNEFLRVVKPEGTVLLTCRTYSGFVSWWHKTG